MKKFLRKTTFEASMDRVKWVLDTFPRVYVSFSGGKDSTVMTHILLQQARARKRKVGMLFVDLEAQYSLTIQHVEEMFNEYADVIDPYWISLPLSLRNAVSQFEPRWQCWDSAQKTKWVREPSKLSITDCAAFAWFKPGMEFEEFVPKFGHWYSQGQLTACLVGIRTQESLNRWRTIAGHGTKFEGKGWTNYVGKTVYNVYPIYDWITEDIWTFHGLTGLPYNELYDMMHKAGLTLHQMRICQPYGDDQRKGLWLYQIIEPETWGKVVARVSGANSGALYAQEHGNINGTIKVSKPDGHTWESFSKLLLATMPNQSKEHFENKIAVFLKHWQDQGIDPIPDQADPNAENSRKAPSWRRICKSILRNDYWCKGLSFSQTKSPAYDNYKKLMKKRREKWNLI